MTALPQFAISHPKRTLMLAMLVVGPVAAGAIRLQLRTDGHALVPPRAPAVLADREIREQFDTPDQLVVFIRSNNAQGIFNVSTLALIEELTARLVALPHVEPHHVSSLATEYNHRVHTGTLDNRRFLEPFPESAEEIAVLKQDLRDIALHDGTIVSIDGQAAAILIGVPDDSHRETVFDAVQDTVLSIPPCDEHIEVIGAPVAEALLGLHLLEDLGVPTQILGQQTAGQIETDDALYAWRLWIARHIGLVPVAIGVMILTFAICFRSAIAALLPLMEVGACLAFVFGVMGWVGVPIYLTIAVMPVILTVVGVADEIHIFVHTMRTIRAAPERPYLEALRQALAEMVSPVTKTSVTTAIGFCAFALSPLPPVRAFGLCTALGVLFCVVWSLTVIPACLVLLGPSVFESARKRQPRQAPGPMSRKRVWIVTAVGLCLIPGGISRLRVQDSWIDGFASDSPFHKATTAFNEGFLGTHILQIRMTASHEPIQGPLGPTPLSHHFIRVPGKGIADPMMLRGHRITVRRDDATLEDPPTRSTEWTARILTASRHGEVVIINTDRRNGSPILALQPQPDETMSFELIIEPFTMPAVLERTRQFEEFLGTREAETVGGVLGPAAFLATANTMARGLKPDTRRIPNQPRRVRWVWEQYERIRGAPRLRQLVTPDFTQAMVTVFLKHANYQDVAALLDAIRAYEREQLTPHGLCLDFAGDIAVSQSLISAIVQTQIRSLMASLICVAVVTMILSRSFFGGILAVLPCAMAVAANFALMGWLDIPLGVATSMFAGMTLGIGVDYAIHMLERFRALALTATTRSEAVWMAVRSTRPAIVVDGLAVSLGFGVLVLSQVPANARLGFLLVTSVATCLAVTLGLLPALLSLKKEPPPAQVTPSG